MSNLDEYVDHMYFRQEDDREELLYEMWDKKYWIDKKGNIHPVDKMDETHIRSIINMIEEGRLDLSGYENDFLKMFYKEIEEREV